jgi:hypothetical protein
MRRKKKKRKRRKSVIRKLLKRLFQQLHMKQQKIPRISMSL